MPGSLNSSETKVYLVSMAYRSLIFSKMLHYNHLFANTAHAARTWPIPIVTPCRYRIGHARHAFVISTFPTTGACSTCLP